MLVTAESCTGGWVSEVVTSIPGSSNWFERGFVTYSDVAKEEMLTVNKNTLLIHGAVSEQTAREMAEGALRRSQGNISVAITGIAGPDGGSPEKPVGTVWLAWASHLFATQAQYQHFLGDRYEVRRQAVESALTWLIDKLNGI